MTVAKYVRYDSTKGGISTDLAEMRQPKQQLLYSSPVLGVTLPAQCVPQSCLSVERRT